MNKTHKRIFGVILVLIILTTFWHVGMLVDAKNADDPNIEEKPGNVVKGQCNTVVAGSRYKFQTDVNGNVITLSTTSKGVFDVYVFEINRDANGNETANLVDKLLLGKDSGEGQSVINWPYKITNTFVTYEFVYTLKYDDDVCNGNGNGQLLRDENGSWKTTTENTYIFASQIDIAPPTDGMLLSNSSYNTICKAFREGNFGAYKKQFETAGLGEADFNQYREAARAKFLYCDSPQVQVDFKEKEVAMMIRNAIASVKIANLGTTGSINGPPNSEGLTIIGQDESTDLTDKPLTCPAYQNVNGAQIPNSSSTVKTYYKTVTTITDYDVYQSIPGNDAQCKKVCEETVTVNYGPPVASKAGLCFEYKVKVESKLNCMTEYIGDEPTIDDYKVCTPSAGCNSGHLNMFSGGPDVDFDSCINACDGGKYSQKCIDKCYDDVYEDSGFLAISYADKINATQIAKKNNCLSDNLSDEMKEYCSLLKDQERIQKIDRSEWSSYFEKLKKAAIEAGTGYYYVSGGQIKWKMGQNGYWDEVGRYYVVNHPEDAVPSAAYYLAPSYNSVLKSKYRRGKTADGFLRNNYGDSYCGARCDWLGCSNAKKNGYYKNGYPDNPGIATNREFLNYDDAADVYKSDWEKYEAAVKECKAAAACTSNTSEFTIKVNNKTKSNPDADNWIEYHASISENGTLNGTTVNGKPLSDTTIILDRSGCYGENGKDGKVEYMTEWSFPGTWVNNKTGKISYQPNNGNAWHLKKEKFCTNLDSKYVNTDWWVQRILHPNTNVAEADKALIDEYNIQALAKDFGYFQWDLKVNCFYALYDSPFPDDGKSDDNKPLSYKSRSVDLKDIFPNMDDESATNNPNETGREPGFNWTDSASNIKNEDYEVTPGALYSAIQARGNEIYADDKKDLYLDYEFYLTPSDLNKIRRYSKQEANGNYSQFPGRINVANGIAFYKSALFRSDSTSSYRLEPDSIITLGALGVNNQERKDSNKPETFTNTYTALLKQSREEYLSYLSGGNK